MPEPRKGAENILKSIHRTNGPTRKGDNLVIDTQTAPIGIARLENIGDHHAAFGIGADHGTERRMVDDPATLQITEKVFDLIH